MDFLTSGSGILIVVLGIGFVIFIHELGHFLFAKWAGVKVLTFSIGMGPVIFKREVGETQYQLALLPVGGYVGMQEEPDGSGRSRKEVHPWWQTAILSAGVLFNLVASFLILLCLGWYGLPHTPAVAGSIDPKIRTTDGVLVESPAHKLGIIPGDKVLTFNGDAVVNYEQFAAKVLLSGTEPVQLTVERRGETLTLPAEGTEPVAAVYDQRAGRLRLGMWPAQGNRIHAVFGEAEGLEPGWQISAVDGKELSAPWEHEVNRLLAVRVGDEVALTLEKGGEERRVQGTFAGRGLNVATRLAAPVRFPYVLPGGSAEAAGIQSGDVVHKLNGEVISNDAMLSRRLQEAGTDQPVTLELLRHGAAGWQPVSVTLTPRWDETHDRPMIGVMLGQQVAGYWPVLPEPEGVLAKAGLQVGDAVLDIRALDDRAEEVAIRFLRGGTYQSWSLTTAAWQEWTKIDEPSVFAKFLGAQAPPALIDRFDGVRVQSVSGAGDQRMIELVAPSVDADKADAVGFIMLSRVQDADLSERLAGLETGDWILASQRTGTVGGTVHILRGSAQERPEELTVAVPDVGFSVAFGPMQVPHELDSWLDAFPQAAWYCGHMVMNTGRVIRQFFVDEEQGGVAASKSLNGPVGIYNALSSTLSIYGFAGYLKIIALLGVNLVIINLIPVPALDGGQLLKLGIEVLIRRPLPRIVDDGLQAVSVAGLICLMLFVFGADILRALGRH